MLYYIILHYITVYYIKLREYDLREHCWKFDNGILEEYEWDYDLTLLDFIEVDINDWPKMDLARRIWLNLHGSTYWWDWIFHNRN